jgi:uncharacterized protein YecE (DUF72 family)
MSGLVHVGTSGWSYPAGRGTWNGVFYPRKRPRGPGGRGRFDELAYYAAHFDTVEVNSTFYRMPEAAHTSRWIARTPSGFLFSVKLSQKFTHPDMYLAQAGASDWNLSAGDVEVFRMGVDPIAAAGRLAALLVQFPPSFHAIPETRDYLDWLLRALAGYPTAVELRHRSWSDNMADTRAQLASAGAGLVLIDEPKFRDSIHRSIADVGRDAGDLLYVRLHGRNRDAWWDHDASEDRYDYLYAKEELEPFAEAAQAAAGRGRRVLMYLNNHFSAKAVANAAILKSQLGQLLPGEYPAEMVERYPDLAGLVATSGLPL